MKAEILNSIWGRSYSRGLTPNALPYLALIDRRTDTFKEKAWTFGPDLDNALIQYEAQDLFFSPLLFSGPRTNAAASLPGVLFADLDSTDKLPYDVPRPSVLWETSPGNKQAVWFLAEAPPDAVRWADINQRLTYAAHADKGGWHASKILRVPETRNFKYAEAPLGKVLWFEPDTTYDFLELEDLLPYVKERHVFEEGMYPEMPDHKEWLEWCRLVWDTLPMSIKSDLAAKRKLDRSSEIVRLSNALKRLGHGPDMRFRLIWGTEWCKWRTDRHNPSYLWQVVNS